MYASGAVFVKKFLCKLERFNESRSLIHHLRVGLSPSIFLFPLPLGRLYEWVVPPACFFKCGFRETSWAKEFRAFWKRCGLRIGAKSKGKILLGINTLQEEKREADSVTEYGHWGALRGRLSSQEKARAFQNTHSYGFFLTVEKNPRTWTHSRSLSITNTHTALL